MIFMLCGTSDARELALALSRERLPLLASVVKPSAAERRDAAGITTRAGRLAHHGKLACLSGLGCTDIQCASPPCAQTVHYHTLEGAPRLGLAVLRPRRPLCNCVP
ncbi:hypothetical protein AMQ83_07980, partial [Paenibacillus riograndensis]